LENEKFAAGTRSSFFNPLTPFYKNTHEGLRSLFVQEQGDWQQTAVQRSDSVVVASVKI